MWVGGSSALKSSDTMYTTLRADVRVEAVTDGGTERALRTDRKRGSTQTTTRGRRVRADMIESVTPSPVRHAADRLACTVTPQAQDVAITRCHSTVQ